MVLAAMLGLSCTPPVEVACPNDLPSTCVVAPSWSLKVSPIFNRACVSCHGGDGGEAAHPMVTWADVAARKTSVLSQIYACKMPTADAGVTFTSEERSVVLQWLVCGAPEN